MDTSWGILNEEGAILTTTPFTKYEDASENARWLSKKNGKVYMVVSIKPVARFSFRPAQVWEEAL